MVEYILVVIWILVLCGFAYFWTRISDSAWGLVGTSLGRFVNLFRRSEDDEEEGEVASEPAPVRAQIPAQTPPSSAYYLVGLSTVGLLVSGVVILVVRATFGQPTASFQGYSTGQYLVMAAGVFMGTVALGMLLAAAKLFTAKPEPIDERLTEEDPPSSVSSDSRRVPEVDVEDDDDQSPTGWFQVQWERVRQNWKWFVIPPVVLVLGALLGFALRSWWTQTPTPVIPHHEVDLQAEDTLRTVMKTDPVLVRSCPQGWDDTCRFVLHWGQIELPPCVQMEQLGQVNTAGVSWFVGMDQACNTENIRQHRVRVTREAARPRSQVERIIFNTEVYQRSAFEARDTVKIEALLEDPALQREVILDFWAQVYVPWEILAHPSLTKDDLSGIYTEIQANGWYEAMPWLIINPNLDPNLRGMWVLGPPRLVGNPGQIERERKILLGLHQPHVPTGAVAFLVDEAVEQGLAGDMTLWEVMLKAAENGDLPVHHCRLPFDTVAATDPVTRDWPECIQGQTWDFISEMKWHAQQVGSPFAAVSTDWDSLKQKCEWESAAGRHSGAVKSRSGKVVPKLADVSPANMPPAP